MDGSSKQELHFTPDSLNEQTEIKAGERRQELNKRFYDGLRAKYMPDDLTTEATPFTDRGRTMDIRAARLAGVYFCSEATSTDRGGVESGLVKLIINTDITGNEDNERGISARRRVGDVGVAIDVKNGIYSDPRYFKVKRAGLIGQKAYETVTTGASFHDLEIAIQKATFLNENAANHTAEEAEALFGPFERQSEAEQLRVATEHTEILSS